MRIWLHKLMPPTRLVLSWEPPLSVSKRTRWAVGEVSVASGDIVGFRYFDENEVLAYNDGRSLTELKDAGFRGYPAFQLSWGKAYSGSSVMQAFSRRLPSKKRSDFSQFAASFRIPESSDLGVASLLSVTAGRQLNDGFTLVDPLEHLPADADVLIEVAGCRHYRSSVDTCEVGDEIRLVAEHGNPHDEHAIQVMCRDQLIGYVNRLQAKGLKMALAVGRHRGELVRKNGTQDRPRLYCAIELRAAKRDAA